MSADVPPIELREYGRSRAYQLPDVVGQALAASGIVDATPDPYKPGWCVELAGNTYGDYDTTQDGGSPDWSSIRVTLSKMTPC